jgi:hypothetical protein
METRRDQVYKAMHFQGPAYVPVYYFNRDQDRSDIVSMDIQQHFLGPGKDRSEWGFTWRRLDETMGQPDSILIEDWDDLKRLQAPDPADLDRFQGAAEFSAKYSGCFRMASLALSGFTNMTFLRGFDNLMADMLAEPAQVAALADLVFGFEEELIRRIPEGCFDAVAFFDDWGTQKGMFISPAAWRRLFKPRYTHQFALAHSQGLSIYFHCCGKYDPIIPDLIEIGVDLLNLSQPNLYDIPRLGEQYAGKVCFVCPVSYQTTSITGTRQQIFDDVRQLVTCLGSHHGGLVGYIEEYHTVGMSEANYQACVDAFTTLGKY